MLCLTCHNETDGSSLFCHVCDAYRPDPVAGKKANVGGRLFAHFLDMFIGVAIFLTVAMVSCGVAGIGADISNRGDSGLGGAMGFSTFFLAIIGYIVLLMFFLARGKTPGKALSGLRVADKRNGDLPGIGRMLLRETLGKFVSGFFLGLGYLWAIFDRDSQAWHDKIAGTVVLKNISPSTMVPVPYAGRGDITS
ncbi:MAG TPA: RDD family protein [Candidatus Aquilonibacter sp.]|jgi:uncharacterized RDD family membrane protein YckC|nr:RDD family protein [Candidatus Aquilonibacter sp.]